jgi:hypothetical protein
MSASAGKLAKDHAMTKTLKAFITISFFIFH